MRESHLLPHSIMKVSGWVFGREIVALLWAVAALASRAADAVPPARIDWAGDLAFLRRELPAKHPNLFFQTPRADFEQGLDSINGLLPKLNDVEIALQLQELIVKMGDDHTAAALPVSWGPGTLLPLGVDWFADGWRIVTVPAKHRALLGRKLTTLGGVPMGKIEASLARLISSHPQMVKTRLPGMLVAPVVLRYCGLPTAGTLKLTSADDSGTNVETSFAFISSAPGARPEMATFEPATKPYGFMNQRAILWARLLPKNRIFYVQYNRCDGREVAERRGASPEVAAKLPSLEATLTEASSALQTALAKGEADRFILDLRFNGGGASDFGTRFAERVARLPGLQERGRVYVIIGRRTFSSAIINAGDFKRLTNAVLVGEPTSGTPNHFGETTSLILPSSRLVITHSTKYFGEPGGPLLPLQPDIAAEMSFDQYRRGHDPALTAIFNAIERQAAVEKTSAGG